MSYQLEACNIKGGQNAYTCLPKEPTGKQRPPGGITLLSPNTPTIIQMIDIYWGKMKENKE